MQVEEIRLGGAVAFAQGAAQDAEADFDNGVGADQQAGPWRYGVVALRQQHGNPGQCEAQEIGPAVPQEYFSLGPVDEEETGHGAGNDHAGEGEGDIAYLPRDDSEGCQDDQRSASRQAVQSVDDVDGVGDSAYGDGGEDDR